MPLNELFNSKGNLAEAKKVLSKEALAEAVKLPVPILNNTSKKTGSSTSFIKAEEADKQDSKKVTVNAGGAILQENNKKIIPTVKEIDASGLDISEEKGNSVHAHFYLDDTIKHSTQRSRSTSLSASDRKSSAEGSLDRGANVEARLPQDDGKFHVLIGVTGSIASAKIGPLIQKIEATYLKEKVSVHVILTPASEHFLSKGNIPSDVIVWRDKDEWSLWKARADPVLHIELRRWADILIVCPMTANTLSKIALGLCDNLLTNVIRAWNTQFPIIVAPSMVNYSYASPVTKRNFQIIKDHMKWINVLKPTEKVFGSYGEIGMGGMCAENQVVDRMKLLISTQYKESLGPIAGLEEDDDEDEEDST